ncbi:putative Chymotrypsin A [Hypsibius exemplaris]|uniref:Chymotrypsin A n=1 Tax=Hypsibius exemplaris TaxID=2072580 RepID=A0A1W0WVK2_HYPEX|nr:putative Chymotrypsin A [Hypsibius exemplaris]
MLRRHAATSLALMTFVVSVGCLRNVQAIKAPNWQASRIILADQSDEPIQASLDDPEAFGEEPVEGPYVIMDDASTDGASGESTVYGDSDHVIGKRAFTPAHHYPGKSYAGKVKSKSAKWKNDNLAARGVISPPYRVGQKKEFELAPKESFQCGIQKVLPNDLWKPKLDLTGGNSISKRRIEARRHSWPWQVDIFFYRVENGSAVRVHLCGGTLVDRWHVITAAHCNIIRSRNFDLGRPKSYYVRLGQHFRSVDRESLQTIRVDKWVDHDSYNDSVSEGEVPKFYLFNDIAFLRLDRPVDLSDQVHPVCMDFSDTVAFAPGTTCYATGWSLDEFDYQKWIKGEYSEVLNESKSKIAKDSYCTKHHSGFNADVTLCTKYYPGHYSCHGDSGGPLQCERDGRFYLVGIVSYDVATSCRATGMTYFTKIRGVQAWIEQQLDKSLQEIASSQAS